MSSKYFVNPKLCAIICFIACFLILVSGEGIKIMGQRSSVRRTGNLRQSGVDFHCSWGIGSDLDP